MARRALIMGSGISGLTGIANDLEMTETWLASHGFEVDRRCGDTASRDGMLDGLQRLVRDSRIGDVAVIYYSGHGGYMYGNPDRTWSPNTAAVPNSYQYLVPTDHAARQRFRGIFRVELSSLLRDLAEKTRNITVILDCCHSTDMIREDELYSKSIVEPWSAGIEQHLEWLRSEGYDLERLDELRNPFMVLLAACSVDESAYEYTRPRDQVRCGMFTDFLLDAVNDRPSLRDVTWEDLMHEVTERVERWRRTQRPEGSGPTWRRVFSEEERRNLGALRLTRREGRWCLHGGRAVGVEVGDRYRIVEGSGGQQESRFASVIAVENTAAVLDVALEARASLRPGMLALPCPGGPARSRCQVQGTGALADRLRQRLRAVAGLGVLDEAGEHRADFSFRVSESQVQVLDGGSGSQLRRPFRFGTSEEPETMEDRLAAVTDLARALTRVSRLRGLACEEQRDRPTLPFSLEWGVVEGGAPRPLPSTGAVLSVGDRIYVRVESRRTRGRLYVSVLDVGVGWDVTLLSDNQPEGVMLGVGTREVIGQAELRGLRGLPLHWPEHVPPEQPLEESLIVFVADERIPIGSWATTSRSALWDASHRDVSGHISSVSPSHFDVAHIRFRLRPPTMVEAEGERKGA